MSEPDAAPAETIDHSESSTGKEHVFPCKQCGADLHFKPGAKDLSCPYCGHVQKIPQTAQEIREFCFNDYLGKPKKTGYGDQKGRDVRCGGCGSVTHFDPSLRATKCAFCGTPLITGDDTAADSDVISPEAVLPFAIGKVQAQQSFKQWISSRWFAPGALKNENNLGQFQGVYRPFWTFDSHTISHWTGERGDAYYVSESYTAMENGKSVTRTRRVRKIRWRYVSGVYREFFDDVLISAGQKTDFPTQYRLSGLKPFTPEFLSGFVAERYVVQLEQGWGSAKEVIADGIRSGIRGQIGGDEQRIHSCDTAYNGITYKHILLPLWLNTYKFGGKTFQFQVNGQTGDVQGTRPYSFWKIFFFILFIAAVIGGVVLLANK